MDLLEKVQMENLDEEQKMLAELIGLEAFKSLVRAFNGTSIYIPKQRICIIDPRIHKSHNNSRALIVQHRKLPRWRDPGSIHTCDIQKTI